MFEIKGERGAFFHWSTEFFQSREFYFHRFLLADVSLAGIERSADWDLVRLEFLLLDEIDE